MITEIYKLYNEIKQSQIIMSPKSSLFYKICTMRSCKRNFGSKIFSFTYFFLKGRDSPEYKLQSKGRVQSGGVSCIVDLMSHS